MLINQFILIFFRFFFNTRLGLPTPVVTIPSSQQQQPQQQLQQATVPQSMQQTNTSSIQQPTKINAKRIESPRRFDSSLGSDTGTSTRESECSEEHSQHSPNSPTSPIHSNPTKLYDSLAAELREKLSGKGTPLLLPPRDYDTVHRSKGNLTAIELRRYVNYSRETDTFIKIW